MKLGKKKTNHMQDKQKKEISKCKCIKEFCYNIQTN